MSLSILLSRFVQLAVVVLLIIACETEGTTPTPTFSLSTVASPAEGGRITISPSGSSFTEGQSVTLTPEANANWVFSHWEGAASGTANPLTVTMNANKSVTGIFVKRDYPLNITVEGQGTVNEVIVTNPAGRDFPHGTTVELTPVPAEGWVFDSWGGDLEGTDVPKRITVDGEKNVSAKFKIREYPLTFTIEGEGTVTEEVVTNPAGREYPQGTIVELTPVPAEGWVFESWGGDLSGSEVPERITVDGERSVTVRFKQVNFVPAIPTKNMFGQPYIIPSCRLLEAYTEGSTYKTIFEYYHNGMLKRWIEIDGGVGVDTATVEYRADGLVHVVREYFNTMTMDYDSEGRLARVFSEHNSSGYRDTTEITYVGDKTVKISQRQFGHFIGDFVHEFDDNYNLIRSVLNDPSTGRIAYERNSDFHTNIPNFWFSLGDFRLHFLLAGDYFDEGTYPFVASSNLIKSMSYINHHENLPEIGIPGFDVLSLNDQGFPTKISYMHREDGSESEEVTVLKYECQ